MTPDELKAARHALGLTLDKLADELGLSRWTIMRYEKPDADVPRVVELAMRYLKDKQQ